MSTYRQDRMASLLPLIAVLLFAIAVVAAISYLRMEEILSERQAAQRDADYSSQRFNGRLAERLETLQKMARELPQKQLSEKEFVQFANKFITDNPETRDITWLDEFGHIIASHDAAAALNELHAEAGLPLGKPAERELLQSAASTQQPVYALILQQEGEESYLGLAIPLQQKNFSKGYLYVRYALSSLLYYGVPSDIYARYAVSLIHTQNGQLLAGQPIEAEAQPLQWWQQLTSVSGSNIRTPLQPVSNDLVLHLRSYGSATSLVTRGLFLLVLALCGLTTWMLLANWQHLRRRHRSQQALLAETNFRRAMENSLVTGMRALDMDGRISYVNSAFCQMTGWSEAELVGQMPPYTFWHRDDYARHEEILNKTLRDKIAQGGYEMRVQRKNGSTFEARMYMSPLIGAEGIQTGWVSAMTDITEPNRIKRQLTGAQARFTRVLDAIDASVSVAPLGGNELLFANQCYRHWFGDDHAANHLRLLAQAGSSASTDSIDSAEDSDPLAGLPSSGLHESSSSNTEIFVPHLHKWLEVRSRYLEWVDGRLAQMVIATDITARRKAEELSAQHAERAQSASRLVTMGEMASSVAHELNQPLTAINNYCNGMVSRIKNGQMDNAALLGALEKTSKQAQRAGQIIQRVRNFVKRSTPNYAMADVSAMVADSVELADIEMRRRAVRLHHLVQPRLPALMVDKILIEQVLVNLMKNAAEAIDHAGMPPDRREVRLEVRRAVQEGGPVIEFSIRDTGAGLSEDTIQHLFEAFYTTKAEGMGIGLNLCRSIVEAHHGRLQAQNLYNGENVTGCCFTFCLPAPPGINRTDSEGTQTP